MPESYHGSMGDAYRNHILDLREAELDGRESELNKGLNVDTSVNGKLAMILTCLAAVGGSYFVAGGGQQVIPDKNRNIADLRPVWDDIHAAQVSIDAAETKLLAYVFEPTPEPDPMGPSPPTPGAASPSFAAAPFADQLPPFPHYVIPTVEECEWLVGEDGVIRSTLGLPDATPGNKGNAVANAYRASIAAGQELPITFGVYGNAKEAIICGIYNPNGDQSVTQEDGAGGYADIEFVGLDQKCEVILGWSREWGFAKYIGAYNIGLRGDSDSFIIRANQGVGKLIIDGCWWLESRSHTGMQMHTSGMHIDKWETLVWRRHKWRGQEPGSPGINLQEHSAYLKSSRGVTWILENDLRGGNRTGFQIRPDLGNDVPIGDVVIAFNVADGYGFNFGTDPSTAAGGGCITVWSNPNARTFIYGNRITNARYGCLVVSGQPPEKNHLNGNGFPIQNVYIADNVFENRQGNRSPFSVTSVEHAYIWENLIQGPAQGDAIFDSPWAHSVGAPVNGAVTIYGNWYQALRAGTFNPNGSNQVPLDLTSYAEIIN